MEEVSLKVTGVNKSFFSKLSNKISKMLIPTKVGINSMLISMKRNSMIKTYENFLNANPDEKDILEKKYEESYAVYLEALDKYVMDSIYKKVKNNTASDFEKKAMSTYYGVIALKENEYVEYKFRKQKYLIDLDNETVKNSGKEKLIEKYNKFYIAKMDWLYKGILKNYSIKLADTMKIFDSTKEWIYIKIFNTLQDYIDSILSIKFKTEGKEKFSDILEEYEKYENFTVGKLDQRDNIEKNMLLLGISRRLFTHSLPLAVADQCYLKLLKDARCLIQDTKIAVKREKAYDILLDLIEEYNSKLLSTKVYWENNEEREAFKIFWKKYKDIQKLKETDYVEYIKQKEILYIQEEIKKARKEKLDYSRLIKYYKRKLVDYGVMKQIRGYVSENKYTKVKVTNLNNVSA
mgnify:FL=1